MKTTRTPEWKTVKGAVPGPVGNLRSDAPRMGAKPDER
jgi:hypothetical protein